MKKSDFYKNINRNGSYNHFQQSNSPFDSLPPNIVMGQLWLQDDTTQVEIVELNSDGTEESPKSEQAVNDGHIWNYLKRNRYSEEAEYYTANEKARAKRRLENDDDSQINDTSENFANELEGIVTDFVYSGFNGVNTPQNFTTRNHKNNCFTIINKPFNSDSSSDEKDTINCANTSDDIWNNSDDNYDSQILSLDEHVDSSKRTIWIYSFKNKRILSENDFELVNIPSQDSESSTSFENSFDETAKSINKSPSRVPSPIPPTYIPRLNLSLGPTLPTLTEVTEPNKSSETPKTLEKPRTIQLSNGWLDENNLHSPYKDNYSARQHKYSRNNVINWMCLSPRERRRQIGKGYSVMKSNLPAVIEVPSDESKLVQASSIKTRSFVNIETTAEINASKSVYDNKIKESKKGVGKIDDIIVIDMDNKSEDEEEACSQTSLKQKPQIIPSKKVTKQKITDPIEKLDSNNWILEEKKDKDINLDQKEISARRAEIPSAQTQTITEPPIECAGNKLWVKNMSLLKPVQWCEFRPITDSIPSLQLSIDTDSEKRSWLKYLAKCFRCFK